ncbi:MAG: amidohydrolase family protein, partial [Flavobacteriales bacterium]
MRLILAIIFAGLTTLSAFSQQTPASATNRSTLIQGGTAHLGTGDAINDAAIGFRDGKIDFVGRTFQADKSKYDDIIDATGKQIYPGFIIANSTLGLQEIAAVRATQDQYEVGTFRPNVRAIIAFNTDSEITPTVRTNGVLMGQITPRQGVISGASGVVHFDGWNWEDAAIKMVDGIHLNWPSTHHMHNLDGKIDIIKRKSYEQAKHEIDRYFSEARAYALATTVAKSSNSVMDLKHEAMRGLFDSSLALYVHANDVRDITEAVHFKREMGIGRLVIVGGYDSH